MPATRRHLGRFLAIGLVAGALGAGCSEEPNALHGSLDEVYDITFEKVRARLYSSELAIEYVDVSGAVPVRITLRLKETTVLPEQTYDLGVLGDISGRTDNDVEIPRFTSGDLELKEYVEEAGARIKGDFDAEFAGTRDVLGLNGDFDTVLEIVGSPPPGE
jgi:hypothetical protein